MLRVCIIKVKIKSFLWNLKLSINVGAGINECAVGHSADLLKPVILGNVHTPSAREIPYYYQYNPIELIWAQVKNEVASKNKTFKVADVEKLTHEKLLRMLHYKIGSCVELAEKIQEKDAEKE